jgi:hypothetical protein
VGDRGTLLKAIHSKFVDTTLGRLGSSTGVSARRQEPRSVDKSRGPSTRLSVDSVHQPESQTVDTSRGLSTKVSVRRQASRSVETTLSRLSDENLVTTITSSTLYVKNSDLHVAVAPISASEYLEQLVAHKSCGCLPIMVPEVARHAKDNPVSNKQGVTL